MKRRRFEADLAEEVRLHREMEAEYRRSGGEGRYFGSAALALEESREAWGFGWLDSLAQDLRYACRGFRKAPAFALTVVGTIGLGLGLNTTLFTVFNTYVLQTIAVHDPYSLYEVWWESKDGTYRATWPQFEELRRQDTVPADMAAHDFLFASVDGRFWLGELVSGNYFPMLAPGASLGRTIEPEDASAPGTGSVMVLSHSAWKNWYGSDPNILGRKLWLRGQPFEVIGVAGPGFAGVGDVVLDFWIPITMHARVNGGESIFGPAHPARLRVLARLKPGATPEAVRTSVLAWAKGNTADLPAERRAFSARIFSRASAMAISP